MALTRPLRLKSEVAKLRPETSSSSLPIARVWVDSGVFHLDQSYDYLIPDNLTSAVRTGIRIQVPFHGREVEALVLSRIAISDSPVLKSISKVISHQSVATSESWKDKNTGERKEKTEWHRVVIFNEGLVSVVQKYLKKGAQVYIEGQLNTNKYTDSNGQEKYSTQIVLQGYSSSLTMLDGKNSSSGDSKKLEDTQLPSDDMPDISQDPDDKVPF